jgi:hypothetical protein
MDSPLYYQPFQYKLRPIEFFVVVLLHCVIIIFLMKSTQGHFATTVESEPLIVNFLRRVIPTHETVTPPARKISPARAVANSQSVQTGSPAADAAMSDSAPTPAAPLIDWTREANMAAQDALAKAEIEKHYRNLAGLSPSQLEWARRMRLAPVSVDSPFESKHDGHCAFIGPIFFCDMKIGKRKVRGDLFKNMREFLDERLTDPLP